MPRRISEGDPQDPAIAMRADTGCDRHDEPWTAAQIEEVLEIVRERLETERRERFVAFGVPVDCYWPASRIYHRHSSMGPETQFRLTEPEVEAFTLNLDYKAYPGAARTPLSHPEPLAAGIESTIRARHSERSFSPQPVPLDTLAKLLELGCGVTTGAADPPARRAFSGRALRRRNIRAGLLG